MKSLLILMRKDKEVLATEAAGFITLGQLDIANTDTLDVFRTPEFKVSIIDKYDVVFIGGLSDDNPDTVVLDIVDFPFIQNLRQLIQYAIKVAKPVFASCGGFQIAAEVIGGRVVVDKDNAENDIYPIYLNGTAKTDPLLHDYPKSFLALSGHNKRIVEAPPGCTVLASSERCPIHVYRVNGKPFYAFQFHPEITGKDIKKRTENFWEKYWATREEYDAFLERANGVEIANSLVKKFVDRIVLGDNS